MFDKKYILVLALLMIGICTISCASATENITDSVSADDVIDDDAVAVSDDNLEDLEDSADDQEELSVDEGVSNLSLEESADDDVLQESPPAAAYNAWVYDTTIHNWQTENIKIYINPYTGYTYSYAYDFYFDIYQGSNRLVHKNFYNDDPDTYVTYEVPDYSLDPGLYTMKVVNYVGYGTSNEHVFSTATLNVTTSSFYAVFSAGNYNSFYNSGAKYSIKVTESGTGYTLSGVNVKVVFSRGGSSVTRYYTSDSNGLISFIPPVNVGTYSVTISSNNPHVVATPIVKSATVRKASVTMKAYKASTYKGFKLTLKATVKSNGKNVNEGTVKFKINGKTYSAAVKNGVATKSIKLSKIKKYKYTATFSSQNYNSKKAKNKAVVKKRYATKISVKSKSIKGYWQHSKTVKFKVTTKKGKKINGGYLFIYDKNHGYYYLVNVKHGKAKFQFNYIASYYYSYGYHFDKKVVTKYRISYIPSTLKYKPSHINFKKTSKYKCPACGKKKTHTHGSGIYETYYYVS
jgi:hypothetical protein